uniref:receptor-interacting serine/threonine-protein kinase 3-like n=1 Tax=Gasterosteus aculeatus aculeatus TaxID=481459 RepID=UPI001A981F38|nr:receptor-interacting serine/threonine-protein kinase 3-like [Gasterosteus aculeatus aculeatus]
MGTRRGTHARGTSDSWKEDLFSPCLISSLALPSWPLVCCLAHQVAVGMNLHQQDLMHVDLKPSNVLLDDDFNAKLADFGLSRVSTSHQQIPTSVGTYKYMPPEAFKPSYQPVRSLDIYSYGILLWSIISGKEPYPSNFSEVVMYQIARGNRPSLKQIAQEVVVKEGLNELVDLMKQCWNHSPSKRPLYTNFLKTTEVVFLQNKDGIHDAVGQVDHVFRGVNAPISNQLSTRGKKKTFIEQSNDEVDFKIWDPIKVSTREMSCPDKVKFVDENRPNLIRNFTHGFLMEKWSTRKPAHRWLLQQQTTKG